MRIFLIALAVVYTAGASFAMSFVIGPALCPAAADLTPLAGGDAEAADLNQWRASADQIKPVVDVTIAEPAQPDRVFARFRADPVSGETPFSREKTCGE